MRFQWVWVSTPLQWKGADWGRAPAGAGEGGRNISLTTHALLVRIRRRPCRDVGGMCGLFSLTLLALDCNPTMRYFAYAKFVSSPIKTFFHEIPSDADAHCGTSLQCKDNPQTYTTPKKTRRLQHCREPLVTSGRRLVRQADAILILKNGARRIVETVSSLGDMNSDQHCYAGKVDSAPFSGHCHHCRKQTRYVLPCTSSTRHESLTRPPRNSTVHFSCMFNTPRVKTCFSLPCLQVLRCRLRFGLGRDVARGWGTAILFSRAACLMLSAKKKGDAVCDDVSGSDVHSTNGFG